MTDPEARVGRHRRTCREIRDAEPFGPDDLAADTNGDRNPRQILFEDRRADGLPAAVRRARPPRLWLHAQDGTDVLRALMGLSRILGQIDEDAERHDDRRDADQRQGDAVFFAASSHER